MTFRDLDEFLVITPIELPIRGKTYSFPGTISARAGVLLRKVSETTLQSETTGATDTEIDMSDVAGVNLQQEILGDAEQDMVRDGLSDAHVNHVLQTLVVWHLAGAEAAEKAWEQMGPPQKPNRAARRASSGSAKSTRKPVSRSGTKALPSSKPTRQG